MSWENEINFNQYNFLFSIIEFSLIYASFMASTDALRGHITISSQSVILWSFNYPLFNARS